MTLDIYTVTTVDCPGVTCSGWLLSLQVLEVVMVEAVVAEASVPLCTSAIVQASRNLGKFPFGKVLPPS